MKYRLVIGHEEGHRIISSAMMFGEATKALAALYQEGHQDVHALVLDPRDDDANPEGRPATLREAMRLVNKATKLVNANDAR